MSAGLVLSAGAVILFGFTNTGMSGNICMMVCLSGLAMIRFSAGGLFADEE